MSYYSTQNGIQSPGNFSISNTSFRNLIQYVSNYTTGSNNMGHVPDNTKVYTISNTIIASSANHNIDSNSGMGSSVDSFDISSVDTSDDINTSVSYAQIPQIPQMMMLMSIGQGAGSGIGIENIDLDLPEKGTFSNTDYIDKLSNPYSWTVPPKEKYSYTIVQEGGGGLLNADRTTVIKQVNITKFIQRFADGCFVFNINSRYKATVKITNPEHIVIYNKELPIAHDLVRGETLYYDCVAYYESTSLYAAYNAAISAPLPPVPEGGASGGVIPVSLYPEFSFEITWESVDFAHFRESIVIYFSPPNERYSWIKDPQILNLI
jgi:hypothetical protein